MSGFGRWLRRTTAPESGTSDSSPERKQGAWMVLPTIDLGAFVPVVGEASYQDALLDVADGRAGQGSRNRLVVATLLPEPDNPYDPQAISVEINQRTVGYIPADSTEPFHKVIRTLANRDLSALARAHLTGGWSGGQNASAGAIGVELHTGKRPKPWNGRSPFLPSFPWHELLPVVGARLGQVPKHAVVTLVDAGGGNLAVKLLDEWIGHVVNRPDLARLVHQVSAAGLPATAEAQAVDRCPYIRVCDMDTVSACMASLPAGGLRDVRRTLRPTGRWVCTRCHRLWANTSPLPARWYDQSGDDDSPWCCPGCWSYAYTHPW
jgi:hypothetical protein